MTYSLKINCIIIDDACVCWAPPDTIFLWAPVISRIASVPYIVLHCNSVYFT